MAAPRSSAFLDRIRSLVAEDAIRLAILIAIAAFLLDWTTKSWALQYLDGATLPFGPLTLEVVRNDGFALSAGRDRFPPLMVAGLRLAGLCAIVLSCHRITRLWNRRHAGGVALLLAGGFGNSADLIFRDGAVVDFIGVGPFLSEGAQSFPRAAVVFNAADLWILLGIGLLAPIVQRAGRGIQRRLTTWESRVVAGFLRGSRAPARARHPDNPPAEDRGAS